MAIPITRSGDICARIRARRWNRCSICFKWHLLCIIRGLLIIQRPGCPKRFDCENQERKDHHFGSNEESFLPHFLANNGERKIWRYTLCILASAVFYKARILVMQSKIDSLNPFKLCACHWSNKFVQRGAYIDYIK